MTNKKNAFEKITDLIVAELETGNIPWVKKWNTLGARPVNLSTGKEYRGINTLILGMQGLCSPYWVTFMQCQNLKGNV